MMTAAIDPSPRPTSIAFHFTRALGVIVSIAALCASPIMVLAAGRVTYSPFSGLVVAAMVLALLALLAYEITFIVTPRERRQPVLLETDWDKSASGLLPVIGWLVPSIALFVVAGMTSIYSPIIALTYGAPLALLGVWLGYCGEQRLTFDPQRRIVTRGGVIPATVDLANVLGVAVHMTTTHITYRNMNSSRTVYAYKVVFLCKTGTPVDAQVTHATDRSRDAETRAEWLAEQLGLPYIPNPALLRVPAFLR